MLSAANSPIRKSTQCKYRSF